MFIWNPSLTFNAKILFVRTFFVYISSEKLGIFSSAPLMKFDASDSADVPFLLS